LGWGGLGETQRKGRENLLSGGNMDLMLRMEINEDFGLLKKRQEGETLNWNGDQSVGLVVKTLSENGKFTCNARKKGQNQIGENNAREKNKPWVGVRKNWGVTLTGYEVRSI